MHGYNNTCPWCLPCLFFVLALLGGCQKSGRIADPTAADELIHFSEEELERYGSSVAYEHTVRGELHAEQGNLEQAANQLEKALSRDPEDHYLRIRLATLLIETGKLTKARRHIEKVIRENPADGSAWLALAKFHKASDDDKTCQASARRAMKVEPENPAPPLWLAEYYRKRDENQRALEIVGQLVEVAPENADAHLQLGEICLAMGNHEQAAHHLSRYLKLRPHRADIVIKLAHLYLSSGDKVNAARLLEMALLKSPANVPARKKLISLLIDLGQKETAIYHLQFLPPAEPDSRADTLERACFYAAADDPYKARELVVSFFGPRPSEPSARLALAKIERVLGRLESAQILLTDPAIQWSKELLDEKKNLIANQKDWAETRFLPCD